MDVTDVGGYSGLMIGGVDLNYMSLGSKKMKRWRKGDWHGFSVWRPDRATCMGKICFETEETAEGGRKIAEDRAGYPLRIYQCPYGAHWHMTSKNTWYN